MRVPLALPPMTRPLLRVRLAALVLWMVLLYTSCKVVVLEVPAVVQAEPFHTKVTVEFLCMVKVAAPLFIERVKSSEALAAVTKTMRPAVVMVGFGTVRVRPVAVALAMTAPLPSMLAWVRLPLAAKSCSLAVWKAGVLSTTRPAAPVPTPEPAVRVRLPPLALPLVAEPD